MIGGTIFVHNAIEHDYCFREAIASLAGVCDEVVCVECESTDGTLPALRELARNIPNLNIVPYEWRPNRDGEWLADICNHARGMLRSPWHFHLQADEVLDPSDYPKIRAAAAGRFSTRVHRLNFFVTPGYLIPVGKVCGDSINRGGWTSLPSIGDAENLLQGVPFLMSDIRLFHYGFCRKPDGFVKKAKLCHKAYSGGSYDPVLDAVDTGGMTELFKSIPESEAVTYHGKHPEIMRQWIKERHPTYEF